MMLDSDDDLKRQMDEIVFQINYGNAYVFIYAGKI